MRSIPVKHLAASAESGWLSAVLTSPFSISSEKRASAQKAVRRSPGYHDEPLRGSRAGQRSIRLSKAYRAFYTEDSRGSIRIITIIEVTKHEY